MIISLDFDDTIVRNAYPMIGDALQNSLEVIEYWFNRGHTIIINSCRTGEEEKQMRGWLRYHKYPFDLINKNSPRMIKKYGGDTRKISADLYIDDKSILWYYNAWSNGREHLYNELWKTIDSIMYHIERPLLICIVGESGSGKTLAADYFNYEYGVNVIKSYTNRPRRNEYDREYNFVSDNRMDNILLRKEDMLTSTTHGVYKYCGLLDDVRPSNIYVVNEDGIKELNDKWGEIFDIYSIRLHRDEQQRVKYAGKERTDRDTDRFTLPDSYFDFVINNFTEEKQLLYDSLNEFIKKFRLKGRFEDYLMLQEEEQDYEY